jgi:exonuclease SbcD
LTLKIFHTADLHIGMKFNSYPEGIRDSLIESRFDVLDKMVQMANDEQCNLFVVSGDLFHNINIPKRDIDRVVKSLDEFNGECVLVMPGNHDYDNEMIDLWNRFNKNITDKIFYINEEKPYELTQYGLDVVVYPAPCHSKHSDENNIGWINQNIEFDPKLYHIGIAHGALEGISPDMEKNYYFMTQKELEEIPVDVWLLGHTHVSYPKNAAVKGWKIFNPGTPEPDGLDCEHDGHAWIITIDEDKSVKADKVATGIYRFYDEQFEISDDDDLYRIKEAILKDNPEGKVVRITLRGRVSSDAYKCRHKLYNELEAKLAHIIIDDTELGVKVTKEIIDSEFTSGSFPHRFLNELAEDEEALQIAYELIREVRECS